MRFKHGTRRKAAEYEKAIAAEWKKNKTFEKSVEKNSADNAYIFYDGPPFITGSPHHGTLLSSIIKDVIPRYQTMKGKRVERVWGWDCHGLPAENFTEQHLNGTVSRKAGGKPDDLIFKSGSETKNISLEEYNTTARDLMVANSALWESYIDRVGRWVDFRGAYRTMDKNFMESVWWAFKELYDKGKIYEGEKVIMYDTKFATPVSKAEVTMDDNAYQTVTDPSVFVKFRVKNDSESSVRLNKNSKVLFVCYSNIGRSQMAKAIYNKLSKSHNAESAGVGVYKEQPMGTTIGERNKIVGRELGIKNYTSTAQEVLLEKHDIDITDASRTQLEPEMLAKYDLVVNIAEKKQTPDWLRGENVIWWGIKDPGLVEERKDKKTASGNALIEIERRIRQLIAGKIIDDDIIDGAYLLAWTTTPWTLPANMALAVNPKMKYVEVEIDGEHLILAKDLAEKVLVDEKHQPLPYEIVREMSGKELVGLQYVPILPEMDSSVCSEISFKQNFEDAIRVIHEVARWREKQGFPAGRTWSLENTTSDNLLKEYGNKKSFYAIYNESTLIGAFILTSARDIEMWTSQPEKKSCYIDKFALLPEYQRCGYADEVLELLKNKIHEESFDSFRLSTGEHQPGLIRLYERNGFKKIGSWKSDTTGLNWFLYEWECENKTAHKVYAADFVEDEGGTGIVHIASAYGVDDYELAQANNIPTLHAIDDNGYYLPEFAAKLEQIGVRPTDETGIEVWAANKHIAKCLEGQGIVWKIDYIRHEYPFNPRSNQRIMYRAIPSWFFDIQGQKPLMLAKNENINWFPPHLKHGRFAKNIDQAPDWTLSRNRFWATAMPVWKGDKGTVKVVGSYAELAELSGQKLDDYHRPWVDKVEFD
ncbi:MAG: GNAT family N-acetyltransferase, partial [Candidatus Nomurabacteria bacterium]|nr:GNAT family N-acetyltransferase [Candidatus Nomurabacteria bacterium]